MSDETTSRGFRIYADFVDSYGHTIRVQQSSGGELDHVWIFATEADGASVKHWKPGGGWESAPRPGDGEAFLND